MTVLDRVDELLRRTAPDPLCDDCIADRLQLTVRQHANHKSRELAASDGYVRARGTCSSCGAGKIVIRYE